MNLPARLKASNRAGDLQAWVETGSTIKARKNKVPLPLPLPLASSSSSSSLSLSLSVGGGTAAGSFYRSESGVGGRPVSDDKATKASQGYKRGSDSADNDETRRKRKKVCLLAAERCLLVNDGQRVEKDR